jgi:hypothetical protein
MYNRVGKDATGVQCGQYISNQIASHGGGGTVSSYLSDPSNRVLPGPKGQLPDGTGVFFPSADGNPAHQHFVLSYTDSGGTPRALEDTQDGGGGGGQRSIRADRSLQQIAREHGTQPVYFKVPAGSVPSAPSGVTATADDIASAFSAPSPAPERLSGAARPAAPERQSGAARPAAPERLSGAARPAAPERLSGAARPAAPRASARLMADQFVNQAFAEPTPSVPQFITRPIPPVPGRMANDGYPTTQQVLNPAYKPQAPAPDPASIVPQGTKIIPVTGSPGYSRAQFPDGSHVIFGPKGQGNHTTVYRSMLDADNGITAQARHFAAGPQGGLIASATGRGVGLPTAPNDTPRPTTADQWSQMTYPQFLAHSAASGLNDLNQGVQNAASGAVRKLGASKAVAEDVGGAASAPIGIATFLPSLAANALDAGMSSGDATPGERASSAVNATVNSFTGGPIIGSAVKALGYLASGDARQYGDFNSALNQAIGQFGTDVVTHPLTAATLVALGSVHGKAIDAVNDAPIKVVSTLEDGWRTAARGAQLAGDKEAAATATAKASDMATARQWLQYKADQTAAGALTLSPKTWLAQARALPGDVRLAAENARIAARSTVEALTPASLADAAARGRALTPSTSSVSAPDVRPSTEQPSFLGKPVGAPLTDITRPRPPSGLPAGLYDPDATETNGTDRTDGTNNEGASSATHPLSEAGASSATHPLSEAGVTSATHPLSEAGPLSEAASSSVATARRGAVVKLATTRDVAEAVAAAHPDFTQDHIDSTKALFDIQARQWSERTGRPESEFVPSVFREVVKGEEPVERHPAAPGSTPVESPIATVPPADYNRANPNTTIPTSDIHADPARFQYKMGSGQGGVASSSDVAGAKVYNPNLAGVLDVWKDPADNQTYVVNGHNRLAKAVKSGAPSMDVRYMDADNADDARTVGALKNIAEGQGTPFDAAKLIRDGKITPREMADYGINLKGQMASQGAALANLSPSLFKSALTDPDNMPLQRAVLIGSKLPDHVDQASLIKMIGNRKVTNSQLSEMIDSVAGAPRHTTSENTLFGDSETTQNLAWERASVASHISETLTKDASALSGAASNADRIEQVHGNAIDADSTRALADENRSSVGIFNRLKNSSGEVSDILNTAARRLANKENAARVKSDALKQYRAVAESYTRSTSGRQPDTAPDDASRERVADAGAGEVREGSTAEAGAGSAGTLFQRADRRSPAPLVPVDIPALDLTARRAAAKATGSMFDEMPGKTTFTPRNKAVAPPRQLGFDLSEEGPTREAREGTGETGTLFQRREGLPQVDDLGFYSHAERVVEQKMGNRMPVADLRKMLTANGVKPDEMHWSGLNDFLDAAGDKPVAKADVLDRLRQNNVQLSEVTKGGDTSEIDAQIEELRARQDAVDDDLKPQYDELEDNYHAARRSARNNEDEEEGYHQSHEAEQDYFDAKLALDEEAGERSYEHEIEGLESEKRKLEETKYGQYQLPGGTNYREHLLTLPPNLRRTGPKLSDAESAEMRQLTDVPWRSRTNEQQSRLGDLTKRWQLSQAPDPYKNGAYRSAHWDEPNVLAHIRTSDRTGPNGEKILHVEEVQSDWHQAGRKEGYQGNSDEIRKTQTERDNAEKARLAHVEHQPPLNIRYGHPREADDKAAYNGVMDQWREQHSVILDRFYAAERSLSNLKAGVPSSPFSKTWHELAAKRILKMAADGGYDKVAWTPGEAQADRYSLHHQVDEVTYHEGEQTVKAYKSGRLEPVIEKSGVRPTDLPGVIGKEAADRLMSQSAHGNGLRSLEGEQLKVGGEGMKGFYDKMLPDTFNKLGKRFGAKVGETTVSAGMQGDVPLHSIDITPEMRKSLTTEGQPLFQKQAPLIPQGSVSFADDGRAIVRLFKAADISTVVHEGAHIWRRNLGATDPDLLRQFEDHYGVKGGKWETEHEESFARDFEHYVAEGRAPTRALQPVFDNFRKWLTSLYKGVKDSPLARNMTPELRGLFDKMVGKEDWEGEGQPNGAPGSMPSEDSGRQSGAARPADSDPLNQSPGEKSDRPAAQGVQQSDAPGSTPVYGGSINLSRTGLSPEANERVSQVAKELGLDKKPVATDADAQRVATALNLSYDDVKSWTRMQKRPGVRPASPADMEIGAWHKAWDLAVRNLHHASVEGVISAERDMKDAAEEANENPSPANEKDRTAANVGYARALETQKAMTEENSALARISGQAIQGYNQIATNVRGEGYRAALASTPTIEEALGKPAQTGVKPVPSGPVRPDVPRPARVRTVSDADLAASVEQFKRAGGARAFANVSASSAETPPPDTLYQSKRPSEDAATEALVNIGKYHIEGGSGKNFDTWRAAVEKTIGEKLPDTQAQFAYGLAKHDLVKDVREKQASALTPIFVDHLGDELGNKGAGRFLQDVGPDIRNKLIAGVTKFTQAEKDAIGEAYDRNQPTRKKQPSATAQTIAKQIAGDVNAPKLAARRSAAAQKSADARRASTDLETIIGARVKGGKVAAKAVLDDLSSDSLGRSAIEQLQKPGEDLTDAEGRRLAGAIDTYRRTTPTKSDPNVIAARLTQIVTDARRGRLGYDSPKAAAKTQMLSDVSRPLDALPKSATQATRDALQSKVDVKAAEIGRDLDAVDDHDYRGIARVMMKHDSLGSQYQQYLLGNILSGWDTGEKILVAHPATVAAEEMRRWLFGDRAEVGAGIRAGIAGAKARGVPEARMILREGPTAATLAGKSWYHAADGRIRVESRLAAHQAVLRLHSAYYQVMQTYNVERGLHLYAVEDGKARSLSGQDLADHVADVTLHPERHRAISEKAIKFGEEETQTNVNAAARAASELRSPVLKFAKRVLLPVANLPLNALGRTIEMGTGILTNRALARMYAHLHPDATAEDVETYRQKVLHRGVIGTGIAAAGALGTAAGVITPPDTRHGRYTSRIKLPFGKSVDVPAGNVGAMLDTGSVLEQAVKTHDYAGLPGKLAAPYAEENPYGRALETVSGLYDAATGKGGTEGAKASNTALGGLAVEHLPLSGLTGNIGSAIDAATGGGVRGGSIRAKSGRVQSKGAGTFPLGARDFVYNAEPGLRQKMLPLSQDKLNHGKPYPQSVLHTNQTISAAQLDKELRDTRRKEKAGR